jgi:mono/diheme cytochrome c family protein
MPDFSLRPDEAAAIGEWLSRPQPPLPPFQPAMLSGHAQRKAESLMRDRLGCHALNGRGGRVGPDLTAAGARLMPAFVRAILEEPAHVAPNTIMPPTAQPGATLDLIASALAARTVAPAGLAERRGYVSPLADTNFIRVSMPRAASDSLDAETLYTRHCGACHGSGAGNGYNARYLRVRPADHTDARAMSARTDDRLYDAIAAGTFFLDGSPEMPGFAGSLEPAAIRALVRHIRTLCACTQPAWASDGRAAEGSR